MSSGYRSGGRLASQLGVVSLAAFGAIVLASCAAGASNLTPQPTAGAPATARPAAQPAAAAKSGQALPASPTAAPSPTLKPASTVTPTPFPGAITVDPRRGGEFAVSSADALLEKVRVSVPARALDGDTPVALFADLAKSSPDESLSVGAIDQFPKPVGPAIQIRTSRPVKLLQRMTVTLPFDPSLIPTRFDPNKLAVAVLSDDQSWDVITDVKIDVEKGLAHVRLPHLSRLQVIAIEELEGKVKGLLLDSLNELDPGMEMYNKGTYVGGAGDWTGKTFDLVVDPLIEYLKDADDPTAQRTHAERTRAMMNKLTENLAVASGEIVFPQLGLAIKGGKWFIEGVEFSVESAFQLQLETAVFGRSGQVNPIGSLNNLCAQVPFFDAVRKPESVANLTHSQLQAQWQGHINQIRPIIGRENAAKCDEAFAHLEQFWKVKRVEAALWRWYGAIGARALALKDQLAARALEDPWSGAGRYILIREAKGTWHWESRKCKVRNFTNVTVKSNDDLQVALAKAIDEWDQAQKKCSEDGCNRSATTYYRWWWPESWSVAVYEGPTNRYAPREEWLCSGKVAGKVRVPKR